MPTCDCGGEITAKNAAGHYRDRCQDCIAAIAAEADTHDGRRDPETFLREELENLDPEVRARYE